MFSVFLIGWSCCVNCSYTRLFSSIYTAPVWSFTGSTNLIGCRDGKQYGVETGTASLTKTTCLVAKQTNKHGFQHVLVLRVSLI